jgi:hypothetical protein
MSCFAKNRFIDTAVWGLALSCKRNQFFLSWNWHEVLLDEFFEPNATILPLPSSEESFDYQLKSIHEQFRSCQVFERLLVVHCVRHLRDFHGRPEILHTIQKPAYKKEHCHHKPVLSAGKFQ